MQAQLQPAQQQIPHSNQVPPVNVSKFQSYAEELANYHHTQMVRRLVAVAPSFPAWNPNFQQFYGSYSGFIGQPAVLAPHQVLVPVYGHSVSGGHGGYSHLAGNGPQIAAPQPVRPMQQLPMLNVSTPGQGLVPVEGVHASSSGPADDPPTVQASDKAGSQGRKNYESREGLKRAESDCSSEDEDHGAKKRKLSS
jgi:hypothetical protein